MTDEKPKKPFRLFIPKPFSFQFDSLREVVVLPFSVNVINQLQARRKKMRGSPEIFRLEFGKAVIRQHSDSDDELKTPELKELPLLSEEELKSISATEWNEFCEQYLEKFHSYLHWRSKDDPDPPNRNDKKASEFLPKLIDWYLKCSEKRDKKLHDQLMKSVSPFQSMQSALASLKGAEYLGSTARQFAKLGAATKIEIPKPTRIDLDQFYMPPIEPPPFEEIAQNTSDSAQNSAEMLHKISSLDESTSSVVRHLYKTKWKDNVRFWIEVLILILVAFTAVIAYLQFVGSENHRPTDQQSVKVEHSSADVNSPTHEETTEKAEDAENNQEGPKP